jgi:microcystin-dependent protein
MSILFTNNASATLAGSIGIADTTIVVASGQGSRFPSPGSGDWFYLSIIDASNNIEIVKVTARATDVLTVQRGQDNTAARAYTSGAVIELRLVAAVFADYQAQITAYAGQFILPSGTVAYFPFGTAPTGWLAANGAAISRTTYSNLYAALGTAYGAGDGATTFAIPDLRGQFIRSLDSGRGVDTGRTIGTTQAGAIQSHNHTASDSGHTHIWMGGTLNTSWAVYDGSQTNLITYTLNQGGGPNPTQTGYANISVGSTGGTETRPTNVALLACIKY